MAKRKQTTQKETVEAETPEAPAAVEAAAAAGTGGASGTPGGASGTPGPEAQRKPTGTVARVRSPKVFATECPRNPKHQSTRVYKTEGKVRRCVCDDCGHTWKQIGEPADPLGEYCRSLADQLEQLAGEPVTLDGEDYVCLNIAEVLGIVEDVRQLVAG